MMPSSATCRLALLLLFFLPAGFAQVRAPILVIYRESSPFERNLARSVVESLGTGSEVQLASDAALARSALVSKPARQDGVVLSLGPRVEEWIGVLPDRWEWIGPTTEATAPEWHRRCRATFVREVPPAEALRLAELAFPGEVVGVLGTPATCARYRRSGQKILIAEYASGDALTSTFEMLRPQIGVLVIPEETDEPTLPTELHRLARSSGTKTLALETWLVRGGSDAGIVHDSTALLPLILGAALAPPDTSRAVPRELRGRWLRHISLGFADVSRFGTRVFKLLPEVDEILLDPGSGWR